MLAENLALLRNLRGMTQEEVAEVIGISRQSYSKWEQGETIPDIEKCDRLAKFYGVAIDALVHQDKEVGKARVAPAPVGKHLWGTVAMGAKGQIVIPKEARDMFGLQPGDTLVLLADKLADHLRKEPIIIYESSRIVSLQRIIRPAWSAKQIPIVRSFVASRMESGVMRSKSRLRSMGIATER